MRQPNYKVVDTSSDKMTAKISKCEKEETQPSQEEK
jgi:hypothetical protein